VVKPRFQAIEVRALLELVRELNAVPDLDGFRHTVVRALPAVVPSEVTAYNEADARHGRLTIVANPSDDITPRNIGTFERYMHQHPILQYVDRTGDLRPRRISDFLDRRTWHALDLYNEFFRWRRIEHQLTFGLASVPRRRVIIALALNRWQRDFRERGGR